MLTSKRHNPNFQNYMTFCCFKISLFTSYCYTTSLHPCLLVYYTKNKCPLLLIQFGKSRDNIPFFLYLFTF
uniref:Putative ovule protein n=1 Tax=Solanum chacoense TaxID=4108 RepID=A0A0V0H2B6_SOLCH